MPHRLLDIESVAAYLHLAGADIERLVHERGIPFEKRGSRIVFRKSDIDMWASQRIMGMADRRLVEYHQRSTREAGKVLPGDALMPAMLDDGRIEPAMTAKTKASVLRGLVVLAEKTGRLYDPKELLSSLEAREALCSTGLPGGFAVPHPRFHQPFFFQSSFLVVARTLQEIPFGAPDGRATNLFFLICCEDDRLHLHMLARLCTVAHQTDLLEELRRATDADAMRDVIIGTEEQVLAGKKTA